MNVAGMTGFSALTEAILLPCNGCSWTLRISGIVVRPPERPTNPEPPNGRPYASHRGPHLRAGCGGVALLAGWQTEWMVACPTLETERLVLRPFRDDDLADYFAM